MSRATTAPTPMATARTLRRRRRLRACWQWSWLATAPVAAVFLHWLLVTAARWHTVAIAGNAPAASLLAIGRDSWQELWRSAALACDGEDLGDVPRELRLPTVQLFAAADALAQLDHHRGEASVDAEAVLLTPGGAQQVKLRYRSADPEARARPKQSFRIRTRTDQLYQGLRTFDLVAAGDAADGSAQLTGCLASALGLITPLRQPVCVFLNGRHLGVYELTELLDEGTLRRHQRMPGDLYAPLEYADGSKAPRAFEVPQQWRKLAENNHYPAGSRTALERLCHLLAAAPDETRQRELSSLLDMAAWGRFGALELLANRSFGSETAGWRLFWDPWRRALEPVVDTAPGWPETADAAGFASRLHAWLAGNGDFLAARDAALAAFFDRGDDARFLAEVSHTLACQRQALSHDPAPQPLAENAAEQRLDALQARITAALQRAREAHLGQPGRVLWSPCGPASLRLQLDGPQPVTAVVVQFDRPLPTGVTVHLRYRRGTDWHEIDLSGGSVVRDRQLQVPARLFGQFEPELGLRPANAPSGPVPCPVAGTYELRIDAAGTAPEPLDVEVERGGRRQRALAKADLAAGEAAAVYCVAAARPFRPPLVWRDTVAVEGTLEVPDDLVIEPGTTIRLHPGAQLLCSGKVTALGTAEAPIRFGPATSNQDPWGTLRLDGSGCDGSRFAFCDVRGGSGYQVPLAECCSMVSVHNTRGVRFADCTFAENHRYDDLIHIVYAEVEFERVRLLGARMDALDCDQSRVVVRQSTFQRCGNDGVDLMTSHALVEHCRFEGCGDKGISIGEDSRLLALQNRFLGCNKALEAKDGSLAYAANCELRGNQKAMNAYQKNWRYAQGGHLVVLQSEVVDNVALPTADKWSHAELVDCRTTGELLAEFEQEYVDGTSTRMRNKARLTDCDAGVAPHQRTARPFPAELLPLREFAGEAWQRIRWDVRGVADGR